MKCPVFRLAELAPGEIRRAEVDGIGVAVVRTEEGDIFALRDVCAHNGAKLSNGVLTPMVVADEVGERKLSARWVLRCPWHGFEFDVADGRCPADPDGTRVRSYPVTVEDGMVVVERR